MVNERSHFIRKFFLLLFCIGYTNLNAQVVSQDSLALVALYNSTNGASWYANTNWLTTRVGLWTGVDIVANRVQTLALPNNGLQGTLPDEFCNLSGLEYIYLQNNQLSGDIPSCIGSAVSINSIDLSHNAFTGAFPSVFATNMPALADVWISHNQFIDFPDLSSVPELSNLSVDNNLFTFEDLLSNVSIPNLNYTYAPQGDVVQGGPDLYLQVFDTYRLIVSVSGVGNEYQWLINGVAVHDNERYTGTNTQEFLSHNAQVLDTGFYSCQVTNPSLPLLTLTVSTNRVEVTDSRSVQTLNFPSDTSMYCGEDTLTLPDSTNFLPVNYSVIYPPTASFDSNNRFFPTEMGTYKIRAYNAGDSLRKPLDDTININARPYVGIPFYVISSDLPVYEGEDLELSVPYDNIWSYEWTLPNGTKVDSNVLYVPNITPSDEGIYALTIHHNYCLYKHLGIYFTLAIDSTVIIYELITPNGDGSNETFYIENLDLIPSANVTVYNVWNEVVYQQKNYANDWDGGGLPVGTYYYLVQVEDWNKTYKGSLYIKR